MAWLYSDEPLFFLRSRRPKILQLQLKMPLEVLFIPKVGCFYGMMAKIIERNKSLRFNLSSRQVFVNLGLKLYR